MTAGEFFDGGPNKNESLSEQPIAAPIHMPTAAQQKLSDSGQ